MNVFRPVDTRAAMLALTLLLGTLTPACAQMGADTSALQVIRRVSLERWIHQDRDSTYVPFQEAIETAKVREIVPEYPTRDSRYWTGELDRIDADISLDSIGRVRSLSVPPPAIHYSPNSDSWDIRRWRIRRLQGDTETLLLPSSRFRELWFPVPSQPLLPGTTWVDTLAFSAEPGEGLEELYRAVRRHHVLADTVLDGRVLPLVRTESEVHYELSNLDVLLGRARRIEYSLTGRTVGMMALDTTTGLRFAGADTARWVGQAILHDSVRGPLRSGVRYERVRTWTRYDSAAYEVLRDSLRADRERRDTGMIGVPRDGIEQRLAAGDSVLADSLLARWRATREPEEALGIHRALRAFRRPAGWSRRHLDSLAAAISDPSRPPHIT